MKNIFKNKKVMIFGGLGTISLALGIAGVSTMAIALNKTYKTIDADTAYRNEVYSKLKDMNVKFVESYIIGAHKAGEIATTISIKTDDVKTNGTITINPNDSVKIPLTYHEYNIMIKQGTKNVSFKVKPVANGYDIVAPTEFDISSVKTNLASRFKTTDPAKAQKIIENYFVTLESLKDFKDNISTLNQTTGTTFIVTEATKEARDLFEQTSLKSGRLDGFTSQVKAASKKVNEKAFKFSSAKVDFILVKSTAGTDTTGVDYKNMLILDQFDVLGTTAYPIKWQWDDKKIVSMGIQGSQWTMVVLDAKSIRTKTKNAIKLSMAKIKSWMENKVDK